MSHGPVVDAVATGERAPAPDRFATDAGGGPGRLVCRVCGRTEDTGCVPAPQCGPDSSGYLVDGAEVVFWGRCPDCRQADHPPRG